MLSKISKGKIRRGKVAISPERVRSESRVSAASNKARAHPVIYPLSLKTPDIIKEINVRQQAKHEFKVLEVSLGKIDLFRFDEDTQRRI